MRQFWISSLDIIQPKHQRKQTAATQDNSEANHCDCVTAATLPHFLCGTNRENTLAISDTNGEHRNLETMSKKTWVIMDNNNFVGPMMQKHHNGVGHHAE